MPKKTRDASIPYMKATKTFDWSCPLCDDLLNQDYASQRFMGSSWSCGCGRWERDMLITHDVWTYTPNGKE